jgi:hypothetical protein
VKTKSTFDKLMVGVALLVSVSISLLDFTGSLDHFPWLQSRIPVITLLIVGTITLGAFTDSDRFLRMVKESNKEAQIELLALLGADGTGAAILDKINTRWQERESEIHNFFDETLGIKTQRALIERLAAYQSEFSSGEMSNGSRARFPWDVTVCAMDLTGKMIYHPNPAIQGTRPNQKHHPTMLQQKNGECVWINQYITAQLRNTISVTVGDEFKHDRFSKVYFRHNRRVGCICFIESHLDILYQLPARRR